MKTFDDYSRAGKAGYEKTKSYMLNHSRIEKENSIKRWNNKRCPTCLNLIPYTKRKNIFCNAKCFVLGRKKRYENKEIIKTLNCLNCGKKTNNHKFCNSECQWQYVSKEVKTEFENTGKFRYRNRKTIRNFLIKIRGNQCEICKNIKWSEKPIPLIVDHISGNPYDNIFTNLRLVCPNCDAQLPTYKGKNKGNGRFSRRDRYRQGKSY